MLGALATVAAQVATTTTTTMATRAAGGIHYAAIAQSIGVAVAAAGLGLTSFGTIAAWRTLKLNEANQKVAEAARLAAVGNEISQQYRSKRLQESRQLVGRLKTRADLRDAFFAARATLSDDYFAFDRLLNFFEDLAILEHTGGISLDWIRLAIGTSVRDNWHAWSPTITVLQLHQPTAYENFEALARKLAVPATSGSGP